jgi:hypothetical protein
MLPALERFTKLNYTKETAISVYIRATAGDHFRWQEEEWLR